MLPKIDIAQNPRICVMSQAQKDGCNIQHQCYREVETECKRTLTLCDNKEHYVIYNICDAAVKRETLIKAICYEANGELQKLTELKKHIVKLPDDTCISFIARNHHNFKGAHNCDGSADAKMHRRVTDSKGGEHIVIYRECDKYSEPNLDAVLRFELDRSAITPQQR